MIAALLLCSACSNSSVKNAGEELKDGIAGAMDSDNKYVLMVKSGYRENNPALTYDKAFSAFFATPRWKYFKGDAGKNIVEFTGDCTYQDVAVKARIQFVVDEAQGRFEATYLAFNEVPQNKIVLTTLIEKAFMSGNKAAQPDNASKPTSDLKYDQAAAKGRIMDWLGEHEFPGVTKMALNPGTASGDLLTVDGKKYHMFTLSGLKRAVDILVDPDTGGLFFYDTGLKPQDLNRWYVEYKRNHK